MRCPCRCLCLLALPAILAAGAPAPARMEILQVIVRGDSGSAQEFRVENQGFLFGRKGGALVRRPAAVNDTLHIVGSGVLELVSADSSKPLSVDTWLSRREPEAPVRYIGRIVRVQRASPETPFYVTTR